MADWLSAGSLDLHAYPWERLTVPQSTALWAWMAETYAPATRRRNLAFLKGVLRSCWRLGLLTIDQRDRLTDWPRVKGQSLPAGRAIEPAELVRMFAASDAPHRALLAAMAGAALRVTEALGLHRADVLPDGTVKVRQAKGGRQRVTHCAGQVATFLVEHAAQAGPGPLFPWNAKQVRRWMTSLCKRLGVPHATPHDCRRTTITRALDQDIALACVQRLAGHASPRTTAAYDRAPQRRARDAAGQLRLF